MENQVNTKKRAKRPTIKNVAEMANVSPAVVSRLLNKDDSLQILPETRERIMRVVKEIGYRPNPIAKGLRMQKSGMIGLALVDFTNPFYGPLIRGVQEPLNKEGYDCLLGETREDPERAMKLVEFFLDRQVDGMIITTATKEDPVVDYLESVGAKYVQLTRMAKNSRAPYISCDSYNGMRKLMEHLISLGHTRIAHIAGHRGSTTGEQLLKAFHDVMEEHHLPMRDEYIVYADWMAENAGVCMNKLLQCKERPSAVVACNDIVAIAALSVIYEKKLQVPEDIAIAGFNNIQISEVITPKLTTVNFPAYEMGYKASNTLLKMIKDNYIEHAISPIILDTELIIRESTDISI